MKDLPASAPLDQAATWLEAQLAQNPNERTFLVVHVRGGHPPWDLVAEEAGKLEPKEYNGSLRARRGALILRKIRFRRRVSTRRLKDEDWVRLNAYHDAALAKQDESVRRLFSVLEKAGVRRSSMLMMLGDVPRGDPTEIPFAPAPSLREDRLISPLIIKFPEGKLAGDTVNTTVASIDFAPTVLTALGLEVPPELHGVDLYRSALGLVPIGGRPSIATLGERYSTRLGLFKLAGSFRRFPKLCELDVDPACVSNVLGDHPIVSRALWRANFVAEARAIQEAAGTRPPAMIDDDTTAALSVWGY